MSLSLVFEELSQAIQLHGRDTTLSPQVRAVIDRHDMLVIDRSDGEVTEVDFGVRQGDEYVRAHFLVYPQSGSAPAHVAYDVDWRCSVPGPNLPDVEKRSWNWDMEMSDDAPLLFALP